MTNPGQSVKSNLVVPDEDSLSRDGDVLVVRLPRPRLYRCELCDNVVKCRSGNKVQDTAARAHVTRQHAYPGARSRFQCRFCDFFSTLEQSTRASNEVRKHIEIEHGEYIYAPELKLPFPCLVEDCDEDFASAPALKVHMRKHDKQKTESVAKGLRSLFPAKKPSEPDPTIRELEKDPLPHAPPAAVVASPKDEIVLSDGESSGGAAAIHVVGTITEDQLDRLVNPDRWIDDEVIVELLKRRIISQSEDFLLVDPVFWQIKKLPTAWGGSGRKRGEIPLPTFPSHSETWKTAFIPTFVNSNHWILAVIHRKPARLMVYDSLRLQLDDHTSTTLIAMAQLLTRRALRPTPATDGDYPRQRDNSSCGPLTCMIAERISRGESLNFDLNLVPIWRVQAANELRGINASADEDIWADFPLDSVNILSSPPATTPVLAPVAPKAASTVSLPPEPVPQDLKRCDTGDKAKSVPLKAQVPSKPAPKDPKRRQYQKFVLSDWTEEQIRLWEARSGTFDEFERICHCFVVLGKLLVKKKGERVAKIATQMAAEIPSPAPQRANAVSTGTQTAKKRLKRFKTGRQVKIPVHKLYMTNKRAAMRVVLEQESLSCPIPVEKLYKDFSATAKAKPVDSDRLRELCELIPRLPTVPDEDWNPISSEAVFKFLKSAPDSSPGVDRVPYRDLRRMDPQGKSLAAIYRVCLRTRKIPKEWKSSDTILIYKASDPNDFTNWRPIALQRTIYKVYSGLLAASFSALPGVISWHQKGFVQRNGCAENIKIVSDAIGNAKASRTALAVSFLDLGNAFGSMPHDLILKMMEHLGLPEAAIEIVEDMYDDASIEVKTKAGKTRPIRIEAGVKQGDPLSPVLFNIGLELLLRITNEKCADFGVMLGGASINTIAYADDLAVITRSRPMLEQQLQLMFDIARDIGITFKPSKCAALILSKGVCGTDEPSIAVGNGEIRALGRDEQYVYLGRSMGNDRRLSPDDLIMTCALDVQKIEKSELMPTQKIDAIRIAILPRLTYICQNGLPFSKDLKELDRVITLSVKRICSLPRTSATPLFIHGAVARGGLGVLDAVDEMHMQTISTVCKGLTNRDPRMKAIALDSLKRVSEIQGGDADELTRVNRFLAGSRDGEMHWTAKARNKACSELTRLNLALDHLSKLRIGVTIQFDPDWNLSAFVAMEGAETCGFDASNMRHLYRSIRRRVALRYMDILSQERSSQGMRFADVGLSDLSNKFTQDGRYIAPRQFRFVHKARLDLLNLGGTPMGKGMQIDLRCRRCHQENETTAHVLGVCPSNHGLITQRHNRVLDQVCRGLSQVPTIAKSLKREEVIIVGDQRYIPDIVIKDDETKKVHIVDLTCSIEGGNNFADKRESKVRKYAPVADYYRQSGYEVAVDALVVGQLGSWDPNNDAVLNNIGLASYRSRKLARRAIQEVIEGSRVVFHTHTARA